MGFPDVISVCSWKVMRCCAVLRMDFIYHLLQIVSFIFISDKNRARSTLKEKLVFGKQFLLPWVGVSLQSFNRFLVSSTWPLSFSKSVESRKSSVYVEMIGWTRLFRFVDFRWQRRKKENDLPWLDSTMFECANQISIFCFLNAHVLFVWMDSLVMKKTREVSSLFATSAAGAVVGMTWTRVSYDFYFT